MFSWDFVIFNYNSHVYFFYLYIGDNNRLGINGNRNSRPDRTDFMHVPSNEPPQYDAIVKNKNKTWSEYYVLEKLLVKRWFYIHVIHVWNISPSFLHSWNLLWYIYRMGVQARHFIKYGCIIQHFDNCIFYLWCFHCID